jgi:hypothetical protein
VRTEAIKRGEGYEERNSSKRDASVKLRAIVSKRRLTIQPTTVSARTSHPTEARQHVSEPQRLVAANRASVRPNNAGITTIVASG